MPKTAEQEVVGIWVGLVAIRNRRVLTLKETGNDFFMLPGGKQEAGESNQDTLVREIKEELGCGIVGTNPQIFGSYIVPMRTRQGALRFILYAVDVDGLDEQALPERTESVAGVDARYRQEGIDVGNLLRDAVIPELTTRRLIGG